MWSIELQLVGHVALAMLFGGVIGAEREWASKAAGFRTHMLVAGASALLVGLADVMLLRFAAGGDTIQADPIRIVEAIVTGLSFIGAGTIIRRGSPETVEGLTTAASFLLSAAIGIATALGSYIVAAGVTVLTLIVLRLMSIVERAIHARGVRGRDK